MRSSDVLLCKFIFVYAFPWSYTLYIDVGKLRGLYPPFPQESVHVSKRSMLITPHFDYLEKPSLAVLPFDFLKERSNFGVLKHG